MVIGTNPGFFGEKDQRPLALGARGDLRVVLSTQPLHQGRVLLPGPVERALCAEAQAAHQSAHRYLAQINRKLPADQLSDRRTDGALPPKTTKRSIQLQSVCLVRMR
jgi:hypothetical protein